MNRISWLMLFVLIASGLISNAQKPQMPTLNYLTIDLTTGHPTIYWTPPPLGIPLFPDPTGYIIYKRIVDNLNPLGRNEVIATVGPGVTSYTDLSSNGNTERLTYLIASDGPTEPSQLTSLHSNIFITSFYDSCYHKIDLTWENYQGWGNRIEKYDVYVGSSPDWTTFTKLYSLSGTINRASILNAVENQQYYVYVEATKQIDLFTTKSNLFHKFTEMPIHPSYMSVDSIIAEDSKVNVYFQIDPTTELSNFEVVRWENSDSIKSIFSRKTLFSFSNPTTTHFGDTIDSWAARTRSFYYKIDALNSCPIIVKVTNHPNTIIPLVQNDELTNKIQWNELFIDSNRVERGNYARYRVIRYAFTTEPLPPFYLPETDQLETTDDVSSFEGQGYSVKFCYQIEGFERNTLGATTMLSRSRIQCTEIVPGVIMPNAIIPNNDFSNNGNTRNMLIPIITFIADYTLTIYNRWGNLIFSGDNIGWDGKLSNGRYAQEGAYVYKLVVHTTGNRDVIKTGNVTVVYR